MYPNRSSESSNAQTALRDSLGRRHHSTPPPDASTPPRRSQRIASANTPHRSLGHATPVTPRTRSRKEAPATPTRSSGRIARPSLKSIEAASTPSRRRGRIIANRNKGKAVAAPVSSSSSSGGSRPRAARKRTGVRERRPEPAFTMNHEPEDNKLYSDTYYSDMEAEPWKDTPKTPSSPTEDEEATFQEMLLSYTRFGGVQFE